MVSHWWHRVFILFLILFFSSDWIISKFLSSIWQIFSWAWSSQLLMTPIAFLFYFIYCILQFQNFYLVLFYDFYVFVKLFIFFMYHFSGFVELSVFYYSSLSFLKMAILNFLLEKAQISCLWISLLQDYCDTLVISCYLDFSCSSKFYITALAFEAATSCSFY